MAHCYVLICRERGGRDNEPVLGDGCVMVCTSAHQIALRLLADADGGWAGNGD